MDSAATQFSAGDEWAEVEHGDLARSLGLSVPREDLDLVLGLLLSEPSTRAFIRIEAEPSPEPDSSLGYLVPGTRFFVNRHQLKDLRADVAAGAAVWVLSQSLTWSAAVALFQKVSRTVRHLSEDEVAVLLAIMKLAQGDRPVPTDAISGQVTLEQHQLDRHLASLSRRGVLWTEGGGWRVAS